MQVGGKTYTEKEAAGRELLDYCKNWNGRALSWIATYRGMGIGLDYDIVSQKYFVNLNGSMTYKVELGTDPRGNITRIDNKMESVPDRIAKEKLALDELCRQEQAVKDELQKPFAQETELKEKQMRLAQLNAELDIDDKTPIEAAIEEEQDVPSIREQLRAPCEKGAEKSNKVQNREER